MIGLLLILGILGIGYCLGRWHADLLKKATEHRILNEYSKLFNLARMLKGSNSNK